MTYLRNNPDSLSNHFDRLFRGIGHRGSSFTDIDGISHDMVTERFLVMEWKRDGELFNWGQVLTLQALAKLSQVTVWAIRRTHNDNIYDFVQVPPNGNGCWRDLVQQISAEELRKHYKNWWDNVV